MEECFLWQLRAVLLFLLKFRNLCVVEVLPVVCTGAALGLLLENQFVIFFYFPESWFMCFLKPGCLCYNWWLNFALLLLGSNLPCLPTEWLINSPVPAEEILLREAVEKHLLLCLKLLLVVLVTINLWGDLSCYCMNRRYKLLKIQRHEKMEKPPSKKHILFQMFFNSLLFSLIFEVLKRRSLDTNYHLKT